MAPRIAKSLETFRAQVDKAWPQRSKASDGWIGDASHAASKSDHNPNEANVVTAFDLTHDPVHGCDVDKVFANIIRDRDARVKYLIRNSQILRAYPKPGTTPWEWSPYTGTNPHDKHGHLSVSALESLYDNPGPWKIRKVIRLLPVREKDWRWARWYLSLGEFKGRGKKEKGRKTRPDYPRLVGARGWRAVHWYKSHK